MILNNMHIMLLVDNSADGEGEERERLLRNYCELDVSRVWSLLEESSHAGFIVLKCVDTYGDYSELSEKIRAALALIKSNADAVGDLYYNPKPVVDFSRLEYDWQDEREEIVLYHKKYGTKDRIVLTKKGELKLFCNDEPVIIDTDRLDMVIGIRPKLFKAGSIGFQYRFEDGEEPPEYPLVLISREQSRDYDTVMQMLRTALFSLDIPVSIR